MPDASSPALNHPTRSRYEYLCERIAAGKASPAEYGEWLRSEDKPPFHSHRAGMDEPVLRGSAAVRTGCCATLASTPKREAHMALSQVLKDDAAFRAEAERKASRLEAMTGAEIASLADDRLQALYQAVRLARWTEECDDSAHVATDPYFARVARYRALENAASAEIAARGQRSAA